MLKSPAEEKVYNSLKASLKPPYEVLPSTLYLFAERERGFIQEGEIDILIFNPEIGLMVIEVKGGGIAYLGTKRQWFSIDRNSEHHVINDPFEQAKKGARWILEKLRQSDIFLGKIIPIPIGYSVFFPDVKWSDKDDLPSNADRDLIFDSSDLCSAKEKIEKIFKQKFFKPDNRKLDKKELSYIRSKVLYPLCHVMPCVKSQIDNDEIILHRFTEEQYRILDLLSETKKIAIKGFAGTGKTMLAVEKARRLNNEGKSVALICFNKPLATSLSEHLKDFRDGITVRHFHGLCHDYCRETGIEFDVDFTDSDFWDNVAPLKMIDALGKSKKRFDAIIIDEGQDFKNDWWMIIESLLKDPINGSLYIFYDPNQMIYRQEIKLPIEQAPIVLNINCRNTKNIGKLVCELGKVQMTWPVNHAEGIRPEMISFINEKDERDKIESIINKLINEERIDPEDIVILSTHKKERSCLSDTNKIAGKELTSDLLNYKGKIRISTLHKFKGLEAEIVLLCDIKNDDTNCSREHLYVATSRAKHRLYIFHDNKWRIG